MAEAFIIDATRSPTGKRKGSLQDLHAADLGAHVIKTIVERNPIPDNEYDDCLLYTSPSPRDVEESRMPSSA